MRIRALLIVVGALSLAGWGRGAPAAGDLAADGVSPVDPRLGPPFRVAERPSLGAEDAPLVVIELASFSCAHCRAFHAREFAAIKARLIDTGLVRWVMVSAGAAGEPPSLVARIAHRAWLEGLYWRQLDAFYASVGEGGAVAWAELARALEVEETTLRAWSVAAVTSAAVENEQVEFRHLGVGATPFFLLRRRLADGRYVQARIKGYESAAYFERAVTQLLKR